MRLATLAISAAALSGCSWAGGAKHAPYQAACHPAAATGYAYGQGYGQAQPAGCVPGTYGAQQFATQGFPGHSLQTQGFHNQGFQNQGFQAPAYQSQSFGAYSAQPQPQIQPQGFGAPVAAHSAPFRATTLGANATFGAAVPPLQGAHIPGAHIPGAHVQGANVKTVIGDPIYVPQPYAAPYPVPQLRGSACCTAVNRPVLGGAMPFGVELFLGTEFEASGDLFTKKSDGPPDSDFSQPIRVGEIDPISYSDAFGHATTIGAALSYDLSPSTTLLGSVSHSVAEGQTVDGYTTVQPGTWVDTTFVPDPGSSPRALDGTFTDLELTTVEAGVRQYLGHPQSLRPYVGASAGFVHNGNVQFAQTYSDDGSFYGERTFINSGWNPTAAATVGAEVAVGPRAAIAVESGVRWRDDMRSAAASEDRITIPLTLRGRLAF
ncbi:hypothetical protein [uncultured Algimonas sp.]|uniref:hypothetical protein n=1 Tax=uncultured Algimonas sp. TaxID=1547920 RepID=UPI002608C361|nr:hypothetical protein [uncultured Algimonas sp.]